MRMQTKFDRTDNHLHILSTFQNFVWVLETKRCDQIKKTRSRKWTYAKKEQLVIIRATHKTDQSETKLGQLDSTSRYPEQTRQEERMGKGQGR